MTVPLFGEGAEVPIRYAVALIAAAGVANVRCLPGVDAIRLRDDRELRHWRREHGCVWELLER